MATDSEYFAFSTSSYSNNISRESRLRLAGVAIDFDDSVGKGLGRFLRQVVPYAARDDMVRIFAREFIAIGGGVRRMCRSIGIPFKGDCGHSDGRNGGNPLFESVVFRLAFGQADPPAIIVNDNGKPPMIAFSILSASINAMMSSATTDCWPLRMLSPERNFVVP